MSCQDQELDDGDKPSPRDMDAFVDSTAFFVVSLAFDNEDSVPELTILVQLPQELSEGSSAARDDLAATVQPIEDLQRRV